MSQLPNIISGLRLLFIPIFILTFLDGSYLLALIIFVLMSISDAFDGMLARKLNAQSQFGAYLDAIADKLMILSAFLAMHLASLPYLDDTISVLFYSCLYRDLMLLVGAIITFKYSPHYRFKPLYISKINTVFQMILIISILFLLQDNYYSYDIRSDLYIILPMAYITITTTIVSGVLYIVSFGKAFNKKIN
ncbi:MAG: hypothetical protein CMD90_01235 [Gammaproteobacteria bacterium]|nr:hypothetical protein [Gammaproteobacteria bacterium]|tara:strand:- start:4627 stop:5202 length:576 start_codon:yes stop_codon:yes gene_type:complete